MSSVPSLLRRAAQNCVTPLLLNTHPVEHAPATTILPSDCTTTEFAESSSLAIGSTSLPLLADANVALSSAPTAVKRMTQKSDVPALVQLPVMMSLESLCRATELAED